MRATLATLAVLAVLAAAAAWVLPAARNVTPSGDSATRVREHVFFLASDAMRGRASGTPEYDRAADYVADELRRYGLSPLFGDSYLQSFDLERVTFGREGWVEYHDGARTQRFWVMRDAMFLQAPPGHDWSAPFEVVYVGLGIHEPDAGWDDYADVELDGKCALFVLETPASLASGLAPDVLRQYANLGIGAKRKARAAVERGAVCVMAFPAPQSQANLIGNEQALSQLQAASSHDPDPLERVLGVMISRAVAQSLLGSEPSSGFELPGTFRFSPDVESTTRIPTANVGAMIRGRDPALRDEVIVLSAHLDGQGMQGTAVLNSANDNASSVAALLEAARLLANHTPRRTVAFLFPAAEEQGLEGSRYFVDRPPMPFEHIRLNINMEMIGKPKRSEPPHELRVYGRLSEEMGPFAKAADRAVGSVRMRYRLRSDDDGPRLFRNADHVNFFLRGIPTLYLYGGGDAYHQPNDDPEHINYDKVAATAQVLVELIRHSDTLERLPGTP